MKILAIDNNRDNLTTLKALLKDALPGCTVTIAANGLEGLALAQSEDPDVILLDIIMHGMDGFEVCRRLKVDPALGDIPVVFLTAMQTDRESRIKALDAGAEAFLGKPPDEQELITQIRAMTKIRAACRLQRQEKDRLAALVLERTWELQQELEECKQAEIQLRDAKDYIKSILNLVGDPIFVKDDDHRITLANRAFYDMFCLDEKSVIGQTLAEAVLEKEWQHVLEVDRRVLDTSIPDLREEELTIKGRTRTIITKKTRFVDESGKRFLVGSIHDITERKRAEEKLRLKNIVFDASIAANSISDTEGIIIEANDAFVHIWGYPQSEVIGRSISHFFRDQHEAAAILSVLNDAGRWKGEFTAKKKDGSTFTAQSTATVIRDREGKLIGYQSSVFDISKRKTAEGALANLNAQNELILNSAAEGILGLDSQGNHTFINPAAAKMLGYEVKELLGLPSHSTWHHTRTDGSTCPIEECPINAVYKIGVACRKSDDVFWRKDGTSFPVAYASMPAYEQGKLKGAVLTFEDITERKQAEEDRRLFAEELARSNVDLQQFAYVASHDLQEPLRMVSSYLQLIERRYKDRLDDDANTFIHYAVDGANRMQALIVGLLEFSRIKTHGQDFAPVEVTAVLQGVCRNLHAQIVESGAVVRYGEMPVIQADEAQITRLFQNLLQNALKFRREGIPPVIDIRAEKTDAGQVFSVHDNGIGIEGQYFERIFTIFQRLHTREQYPGTGIGLSICKRIVERHGGKIWLESTADAGTSFYFSIPGDLQ